MRHLLLLAALLLAAVSGFAPLHQAGMVRRRVHRRNRIAPTATPSSWTRARDDLYDENRNQYVVPLSTTGSARATVPLRAGPAAIATANDIRKKIQLAGPSQSDRKALVSAAAFVAVDVAFRRLFQGLSVAFPSSLAACSYLFGALLLIPPPSGGESNLNVVAQFLQPGAALLAKWLPLFFVPSLITLPLADTSSVEVGKVAVTIAGGFFWTLLSTAFSVQLVRKLKTASETDSGTSSSTSQETQSDDEDESNQTESTEVTTTEAAKTPTVVKPLPPPPKKFSDELFNFLSLLTIGSGAAGLIARKAPATQALFFLSTTVSSFVYGARLPERFTKLVHPLVTCTVLTWTVLAGWAALTRQSFLGALRSYTRGGGLHGARTGAGDLLLFLLGPAVVSLAVSMYERRRLMRDNLPEVGTAVAVSTVGGLFGTAFTVRWLNLISPYLRLSLLSRNITSPLAMAIAGILGADVSLAVSMVVITGLIGANFGASVLDACGIKDPVARGLGIGAAAHGLGTAAFANEKDAFPFAAIVRNHSVSLFCILWLFQ